ncbi:MAG: hypothetical protein COX65_09610 [Elusimicrobia bacterium CG_4_10_14_0_2_um_filter_56_8]|nr:MAG: hypothetical protein AUJ51_01535 [Elusimicrobia bacterium CG1_02_56_21]PJA11806.1 MAG: hypothetical protein COX65_09610 [Elusimicrobia bacterium CG_4_10_14_0_2_um_filter_56_8]
MKKNLERGFTLIELMIVVAIIGILSAAAIPKFAELIKKSREGATLGHLSAIRSALRIYYGDKEGLFPACPSGPNSTLLQSAMIPKYLDKWPDAVTPGRHPSAVTVDVISGGDPADSDPTDDGEWVYVGNSSDLDWGRINVECYHQDLKGVVWSTY